MSRVVVFSAEKNRWLAEATRVGYRNRPAPIEEILHLSLRGQYAFKFRTVPAHHTFGDGVSDCRVCGKTVIRGQGRWWER